MLSPDDPGDFDLVRRLRAREEAAYRLLVRRDHARLVAVAQGFTRSRERAEEVVQETWVTLLAGLDAYEGRSSLRTWLTGIVVHKARRAGAQARRTRTFSDLVPADASDDEADAFGPDAFLADGHWSAPPWHWSEGDLEEACGERQMWAALRRAVEALPEAQRAVVTLRDVEGLSAAETECALGVSEARQRVLLHRGRVRLQAGLAALARGSPAASDSASGRRP